MLAICLETVNQSADRIYTNINPVTKPPESHDGMQAVHIGNQFTDLVPRVRVVLQRHSVILDLRQQVRGQQVSL